MSKKLLAFSGALALAGALAAPAAASAAPIFNRAIPSSGIAPIATSGVRRMYPHVSQGLTRAGAVLLGPASLGNRLLTFDIQTASQNQSALMMYARMANTPGSIYYRHWISPAQIAASFGTPQAQYDATAAYFRSYGFAVRTWQTRMALTLTAHQAEVEAAFGTKLGIFAIHGKRFYAPARTISLPTTLSVASISPITNVQRVHSFAIAGGSPAGNGGGLQNNLTEGYGPLQLAEAFDLNEAYQHGYTGKGINIGIIGTGPISLNDFPAYRSLFNLAGSSTVSLAPVTVNGDSTPPPVTAPCTSGSSTAPVAGCNPEDGEAQIDTEQAAGLARDANVYFYLAYNGAGCNVIALGGTCVGGTSAAQGLALTDDEILQAVDDNKVDALSLSYGGCELVEMIPEVGDLTIVPGGNATGNDPTMFAELAAEGIATFVSTGDSGSAGCQEEVLVAYEPVAAIEYPASDPDVVAVGGTTTPIGANGQLSGPITEWGQQTKLQGSTAGKSQDFVEPSYQAAQTASNAICSVGAGTEPTSRCVPDVSLNGDPNTGVFVMIDSTPALGGPNDGVYGGTSVAAPEMAGMWGVVLSACEATPSCLGPNTQTIESATAPAGTTIPRYRLGNPNFLLYPILANAAKYQSTFYDVVFGTDGVPPFVASEVGSQLGTSSYAAGVDPGAVFAGPGFDEESGIGAPFGYQLIKYVVPGAH
jgi:subtilase family serine protease